MEFQTLLTPRDLIREANLILMIVDVLFFLSNSQVDPTYARPAEGGADSGISISGDTISSPDNESVQPQQQQITKTPAVS